MRAGRIALRRVVSPGVNVNDFPHNRGRGGGVFPGLLLDNPSRISKPLSRELSNHRIAHRGEYRVLIRVDDLSGTVLVVRIDHRAHAYRPR